MEFRLNLTDKFNSVKLSLATLLVILPFSIIISIASLKQLGWSNSLMSSLVGVLTDPRTGHASTLGWVMFMLIVLALPIVGLLNLLSVLDLDLKLKKWTLSGYISFKPHLAQTAFAVVILGLALLFDGHLILDSVRCSFGYIPACD